MRNFAFIVVFAGFSFYFRSVAQDSFSRPVDVSQMEMAYPYVIGHLRLNKQHIRLNNIKNTEIVCDTIRVWNSRPKPMGIKFKKTPAYIDCSCIPAVLEPQKSGLLVIRYDPAKKNDFGMLYDDLTLLTNDNLEPQKSIYIMLYIEEDFSRLTKEEMINSPKIQFKSGQFNFGKLKKGETTRHSFEFTNTGKSELLIHSAKASCGCTLCETEKSRLKPGETSRINVVFDSSHMDGEQQKTIHVYCNDPEHAVVNLFVEGVVE